MRKQLRLTDVAALIAIVALSPQFTPAFEWDEVNIYMAGNLRWGQLEWGLLYQVWYQFLASFPHTTAGLYEANQWIMGIAPFLFAYVAMRGNGVKPTIAMLASLGGMYLLLPCNIYPKVSHFALCIILLGFALYGLARREEDGVVALASCITVSALARPEMALAAIVLWVLALVLYWKAPLEFWLCLPIIVGIGLSLFVPRVFLNHSSRSQLAFSQHYALNQTIWDDDPRIPWVDRAEIMKEDFGREMPFSEALVESPIKAARHVLRNVANGTPQFALVIVLLSLALLMERTAWSHRLVAELGVVCMAPVALSCLTIFPRWHHLLVLLVLSGVVFVIATFRVDDERGVG